MSDEAFLATEYSDLSPSFRQTCIEADERTRSRTAPVRVNGHHDQPRESAAYDHVQHPMPGLEVLQQGRRFGQQPHDRQCCIHQLRTGWLHVTPDAENEGRLLLMPSKMNIAPIKYGLAYRIESALLSVDGTDVLTSRIAWEFQPVKMSADEALAAHDISSQNKTGKAEAIEYLRDALSGGARPASEIKQEATGAGITPKSLRTAREALGVRLTKQGMSGGWVWDLPKVPSTPEGAPYGSWASSASEGIFGDP
jgi:hypothetical protein